MPRRINAPRLVNPLLDNDLAERRLLDLATTGQVRGDVRRIAHDGLPRQRKRPVVHGSTRDGSALTSLLRILAGDLGLVDDLTELDGLIEPGLTPLHVAEPSDTVVPFGTGLTSIDTRDIGPLVRGVKYLIVCSVHLRLSSDGVGFARAYARIGQNASVIGTRTGTVDGERSCRAATSVVQWGTGGSETLHARADMDTNTGYASASFIEGWALPIGRA